MNNLFQGYVECKNKKCVEKIKGRSEFKSFDQVKNLPEYAGVLAKDTILIDIDESKPADLLYKIVTDLDLKCRVYQTTRGKHFLFKNNSVVSNKVHCSLAIGITADIKLGTRNSYEVLKFDGKEREILRDSDEVQTVPKWLFPVSSNVDFLNLGAGDGRNQTLFNYILTLQSNDFTNDEARQCIEIINNYVLQQPLPKSELETILREESFQKPAFYNGTTFLFEKFAEYFRLTNHVLRINNRLHFFNGKVYVSGQKEMEAAMIKILPLNRSKRKEVYDWLDLLPNEAKLSNANMIAFRNGILDIQTEELKPFSPDHLITNMIGWDYNPNAYAEIVDHTLNKLACQDSEIRALLEEIIGYCFYRRNELGKAFILTGDKSNGKSTYLYMIQMLLGDENIAALDLNELGDKFKTAELFGKLANIGDDIGDEFIPDASVFKKLVTGDRKSVERKGEDPFEFNNYSKMLFSANKIPRMKDQTGAVRRRMIIIPFNARFSVEDPDFRPYIKYELIKPDCMEYLINLGIQGLKRVLENQMFTSSAKVEKELEEFDKDNNPILLFIEENGLDTIDNEPQKKVYAEYSKFCFENNLKPLSATMLRKQIESNFDFELVRKTINRQSVKIYQKR